MANVPDLDEIVVVDYQPSWPALFEEEKTRIVEALGDVMEGVVAIDHVGSTAVPGLAAKPVIDNLIGVRDLSYGERSIAPLEGIGYEYRGEAGILGRYYFRKGSPRSHHLHLVEHGRERWRETIDFRDYLRAHPGAVREYEELKRSLAAKHRAHREAYTDGKAPFIRSVLERARAR